MNITVLQASTPAGVSSFSTTLDFIDKLPITELLVGIVVPIVAALISYALAERSTRRKEYNRLFIQIELIKKELLKNKDYIFKFTSKFEEQISLNKELEFPLVFSKEIIVNVLNKLEKIKSEYFYFQNDMLFEKPNVLYILAQKIENIDADINAEELKIYDDKYLEEKQKILVSKLKEQKVEYINESKKDQDRDIYKEFLHMQSFIESNLLENFFVKKDIAEENFIILKHFYNAIKEFNLKDNKSKSDVALLYEKLLLFKIKSDIIKDGQFDQDTFDFNRNFEIHDDFEKSIYHMWGNYYKLIASEKFVENYKFDLPIQKWYENRSDLVLLSDSELYISINELYEELEKFQIDFEEKKNDELQEFYNYSKSITQSILKIITKLEKHQAKIEKWCK